jgi:hypothetical protein
MSAKTVAEKLLIKPNTTIWTSDAAHPDLIEPLPSGVRSVGHLAQATAALVFAEDAGSLRGLLARHAGDLASPGIFWVAYPKANRVDLNRDSLWPILGEHGMRPISQVAIDDVWSALRFRPTRADEPPFTAGRS